MYARPHRSKHYYRDPVQKMTNMDIPTPTIVGRTDPSTGCPSPWIDK
jgi:hypothetical protein